MLEIAKWISVVLMWAATGLNLYAFHVQLKTRKKLDVSISACQEAMKAMKAAKSAYLERTAELDLTTNENQL